MTAPRVAGHCDHRRLLVETRRPPTSRAQQQRTRDSAGHPSMATPSCVVCTLSDIEEVHTHRHARLLQGGWQRHRSPRKSSLARALGRGARSGRSRVGGRRAADGRHSRWQCASSRTPASFDTPGARSASPIATGSISDPAAASASSPARHGGSRISRQPFPHRADPPVSPVARLGWSPAIRRPAAG